MSQSTKTQKQRFASNTYLKRWRFQHRNRAFAALGGACSLCRAMDNVANDLRIEFIDRNNPLRAKYQHNPVTLHRRVWKQPKLKEIVILLCNICRIEARSIRNQKDCKTLEVNLDN